jgi:hypothetical protein
MRPWQTVVVCGAAPDAAQFEPFVWPARCVLRTPLGLVTRERCGEAYVAGASEAARRALAEAYVAAVGPVGPDDAARARAVATWLAVVEGATRVACTLAVAHGAVELTAVPYYVVRRRGRRARLTGPNGASARVELGAHDGLEHVCRAAHAAALIADASAAALCAAFRVEPRSKHVVVLHPRDACALCGGRTAQHARRLVATEPAACPWAPYPLPPLVVCARCPHLACSFGLLGLFFYSLRRANGALDLEQRAASADAHAVPAVRLPTVWTHRARVALAVARAVRLRPDAARTPFARAMAAALRDVKLCRVVVERLAAPAPRPPPRALAVLLG